MPSKAVDKMPSSSNAKGKQRQIDPPANSQKKVQKQQVKREEPDAASDDSESSEEDDEDASDQGQESDDDDDKKPLDLDKIRKRMHYAVRQMTQKAKQARKFEIQRLVKRMKSCPQAEKSKLESELGCLKSIKLQNIACSALIAKLGKAKLIPRGGNAASYKTPAAQAESMGIEEWPTMAGVWSEGSLSDAWTAPQQADNGSTSEESKVKARLLSHKLLAEESARLVEVLSRLAGREKVVVKTEETKTKAGQQEEERQWSGSEDEEEVDGDELLEADSESENDEQELDEEAIQQRIEQLGDMDQWDALVAKGSEEEDDEDKSDSESDSEAEDSEESKPISKRKRERSPSPARAKTQQKQKKSKREESTASSDSDSESESESGSESESESESDSSHFLPSLSHGFITHSLRTKDDDFSGGEDSDSSAIDSDVEDKIQGKSKGSQKSSTRRKNRMGQRARKALWEKKFGKNANHVKLKLKSKDKEGGSNGYKPLRRGRDGKVIPEFKAPEVVDSGWKKFPVNNKESAKPLPQQSTNSTQARRVKYSVAPDRPIPQQQPTTKTPTAASQEMHPSWIAKQKQKEKEDLIARSLSGGGGAGKKVTFD
ncbi:unnamed protein product [Sympodiomycopsis kandeliae]